MGASVILRWPAVELQCVLQVNGPVTEVSLRQKGEVVRSAIVGSASAGYEWATEQIKLLQHPQRRAG